MMPAQCNVDVVYHAYGTSTIHCVFENLYGMKEIYIYVITKCLCKLHHILLQNAKYDQDYWVSMNRIFARPISFVRLWINILAKHLIFYHLHSVHWSERFKTELLFLLYRWIYNPYPQPHPTWERICHW